MSVVTVKIQRLRQAPRKVRLIIDLVRGLRVAQARQQLAVLSKRAALPVNKLLASAAAAAKSQGLDGDALWIKTVSCDQGTALKRRRLNSRGRASLVKKFYSHVTLTVSDEARQSPNVKAKMSSPSQKSKSKI